MKINEVLTEARQAPLYHFTTENNFFNILKTDNLVSRQGQIWFTRDYSRQFVPHPGMLSAGSLGFRINQSLLHQRYGKKLHPAGHNNMSTEKIDKWLADPKNASTIADIKSGGKSGLNISGVSVNDIVNGKVGQADRWESEEILDAESIPNFHEYLTGIVYAGGNKIPGRGKRANYTTRNPNPNKALDDLANELMSHYRGESQWQQRDNLIAYMTQFNIPFVINQQDISALAVKNQMIEIWRKRKAERNKYNVIS